MKKIIWMTAIYSALFFLVALATYIQFNYVWKYPMYKPLPVEANSRIREINDIEHLRQVTLQLAASIDNERSSGEKALRSGADLLIAISVWAGVLFLHILGLHMKFFWAQLGRPIPWWLRWL
jgi:hypothetical protein